MGEEYHEWHGDISQRKDVNSRQWRFVTHDGLFFWIIKRDFSTVHQTLGIADRQCHCRLRHASEGLHQGIWPWSIGAIGERFSVSAIVGKIMQWNWLFWFVAVRWNSQIIKREERDRMQHRKLRLCGCSYQTEGITIFWIYRQPRDILSEHNKRRTPCSICYNHHRSIKGTRCIFFRSKS